MYFVVKSYFMSRLSSMAESLIGSEIVKLGNEINTRIAKGEKIYNYTIGDFNPDIFPIPKLLEEKIIEGYQQHQTNYPPGDGVKELREAVRAFIKKYEGIDYSLDEIQIASGGRPIIYTAFRTIVDANDKVIYATPSWNNNHYTHLNWGVHCNVQASAENLFMPTAEDLAPHIPGAALLCLCSPQNPTGTTFTKETLEKICDLVIEENHKRGPDEKKLYVLFDQMYWMLTYGNTRHYNPVSLRSEMKEYTIFVDGISKVFAATGVRVGWALGPAKVISKMKALISHVGTWAPLAEQKATALFLNEPAAIDTFLTPFKEQLHQRLQLVYEHITRLKAKGYPVDAIEPQAALYLTIKLDLVGKTFNQTILKSQEEVTNFILGEAQLAIVPFSCFGATSDSPWYRLSVGTCRIENLNDVFAGLERALSKLQ